MLEVLATTVKFVHVSILIISIMLYIYIAAKVMYLTP